MPEIFLDLQNTAFYRKERNKTANPQEMNWSWDQSTLTNTSIGIYKNILLYNLFHQSPSHALILEDFSFYMGKMLTFHRYLQ